MDYKRKYQNLKKKYTDIKKMNAGTVQSYDISQKSTIDAAIINDYQTALNYLLTLRVNDRIYISTSLYYSLNFYTHYSNTYGRDVYRSNSICGGDWYFDLITIDYVYTQFGNPVSNVMNYIEMTLVFKTNSCQPPIGFVPSQSYINPQQYYDQAYKDYKKKKKLKEQEKELDELEDSLDDRESELDEREKKLRKKQRNLRKKKKTKKKVSKKKGSKKKGSKKKGSKKKGSKKKGSKRKKSKKKGKKIN